MSELLTGSRYAACMPVALANAAGYRVDAGPIRSARWPTCATWVCSATPKTPAGRRLSGSAPVDCRFRPDAPGDRSGPPRRIAFSHNERTMSSIDDHANGAEQTRSHPNSAEECRRVVRLVCSYAQDADDARRLCAALGLHPRDGCTKTMGQRRSGLRSAADSSAPQQDSSRRPTATPDVSDDE